MNLQKKAILIVVSIVFITVAINTTVLTFIASSKYREAVLSKYTAVGESLLGDLKKVIDLGIPLDAIDGTDERLREMVAADHSIGYAVIMDTEGNVLYSNDASLKVKKYPAEMIEDVISSGRALTKAKGNHFNIYLPITDSSSKTAGVLTIGVHKGAAQEQLYLLLAWAVGIASVCFLFAVGLTYLFITRFITHPILRMEEEAEKIASGDLSITLDIHGDDEIASLGRAIDRMAFNLKDMIGKIRGITEEVASVTSEIESSAGIILKVADDQKQSVDTTASAIEDLNGSIVNVAENTETLSRSAENTSSAMIEMKKAVEHVAENAMVVDESSQEASSSIEQMVTNIRQIAESIEHLAKSSESVASSITEVNSTVQEIEMRAGESTEIAVTVHREAAEKGLSAVQSAVQGMEQIRERVTALSDNINTLGKRSKDIGKILKVISDVTDQTSLLSLNAAILAAQAGEHGKSFAVVADSIKDLAERTSRSTKEISEIILAVQQDTQQSMRLASEGLAAVEDGLRRVSDVSEVLNSIVERANVSADMARAIKKATAEQTQVVREITDSTRSITDQIEKISLATQEQNKGSMFILSMTEKLRDVAHQLKTATAEQTEGSGHVISSVEEITSGVEAILRDIVNQKGKSADIVAAVGKIREATERLVKTSNGMESTVAALKAEADRLSVELRKFRL